MRSLRPAESIGGANDGLNSGGLAGGDPASCWRGLGQARAPISPELGSETFSASGARAPLTACVINAAATASARPPHLWPGWPPSPVRSELEVLHGRSNCLLRPVRK